MPHSKERVTLVVAFSESGRGLVVKVREASAEVRLFFKHQSEDIDHFGCDWDGVRPGLYIVESYVIVTTCSSRAGGVFFDVQPSRDEPHTIRPLIPLEAI